MGLAKFERNLIGQNQGWFRGCQSQRNKAQINPSSTENTSNHVSLASPFFGSKNHTIKEICQTLHISKPTLYKYLRK
jgi:hypothetical protein